MYNFTDGISSSGLIQCVKCYKRFSPPFPDLPTLSPPLSGNIEKSSNTYIIHVYTDGRGGEGRGGKWWWWWWGVGRGGTLVFCFHSHVQTQLSESALFLLLWIGYTPDIHPPPSPPLSPSSFSTIPIFSFPYLLVEHIWCPSYLQFLYPGVFDVVALIKSCTVNQIFKS